MNVHKMIRRRQTHSESLGTSRRFVVVDCRQGSRREALDEQCDAPAAKSEKSSPVGVLESLRSVRIVMDQLGVKVDEVISNFLEQTEALRTENAQKSAKVDQLTKVVSDLESDLAKVSRSSRPLRISE